jgi:amino acid adenylation domain-containing protein
LLDRGTPGRSRSSNANVAGTLWDSADSAGDRQAVVMRGRAVSYDSLRARAAAVAAALRQAGVQANERAAIFLERDADAAAVFFGVLAAGAVAVVINETLRPRQVEHILAQTDAVALLTSATMLARQPRALQTVATILRVADVPKRDEFEPTSRLESDVAQIIHTSGSTGLPKGATITHGNLRAGIKAVTESIGITGDDRIASLLPFSFNYGGSQLLCSVASAATLVIERSPVPQQIVTTLRNEGVTVLPAVPPLWLQLLAAPAFTSAPIDSLRAMTNTGGRLPVEAVRKLRAAQPGASLFLMYGLTEAFRGTCLDPAEVDRHPDSIGRAIPGGEIMVLRDDGTPCGPGEVGELVQRGPTVGLGYWKDPGATALAFRPNPLRPAGTPDRERVLFSGDLVRRDEDGLLYFLGRRDRMIKTMGYRVSPDEVAEVLYASGQIVECVVDAEPDALRGDLIIARVVLAKEGCTKRLRAFCRGELPRYMQPARIDVLDALPRTTSGKYDMESVREKEPVA